MTDFNYLYKMKQFFFILAGLLVILLFSSCGEDEPAPTTPATDYLALSPVMVDGTAGVKSQVRDCVIDGSGNVYCTGNVEGYGHKDIFVVKLTASHVIDTSWGTGGYVTLNPGTASGTHDEEDVVNDIAINNDSLYIAGQTIKASASNRHSVVIRLNLSTGAVDNTFAGGAFIWDESITSASADWHRDESEVEDEAEALAFDAAGNIYVAGRATKLLDTSLTSNDMYVIKLDTYGVPVPAFGTLYDNSVSQGAGSGVFGYNGTYDKGDKARDICIDSSDSIYISGLTRHSIINQTEDTFTVMKLTTAGELDPAFGTGGMQFVDIDSNNFNSDAKAMALSGTTLYVTGKSENVTNTNYDMLLAAINSSDGSLLTGVTGFNNVGFVTEDGNYGGKDDEGRCVAVSDDGSTIYVSGFIENGTNKDRIIWVYNSTGAQIDAVTADADGYDDEINCMLIDGSGRLVLGGYINDITAIVWFPEM